MTSKSAADSSKRQQVAALALRSGVLAGALVDAVHKELDEVGVSAADRGHLALLASLSLPDAPHTVFSLLSEDWHPQLFGCDLPALRALWALARRLLLEDRRLEAAVVDAAVQQLARLHFDAFVAALAADDVVLGRKQAVGAVAKQHAALQDCVPSIAGDVDGLECFAGAVRARWCALFDAAVEARAWCLVHGSVRVPAPLATTAVRAMFGLLPDGWPGVGTGTGTDAGTDTGTDTDTDTGTASDAFVIVLAHAVAGGHGARVAPFVARLWQDERANGASRVSQVRLLGFASAWADDVVCLSTCCTMAKQGGGGWSIVERWMQAAFASPRGAHARQLLRRLPDPHAEFTYFRECICAGALDLGELQEWHTRACDTASAFNAWMCVPEAVVHCDDAARGALCRQVAAMAIQRQPVMPLDTLLDVTGQDLTDRLTPAKLACIAWIIEHATVDTSTWLLRVVKRRRDGEVVNLEAIVRAFVGAGAQVTAPVLAAVAVSAAKCQLEDELQALRFLWAHPTAERTADVMLAVLGVWSAGPAEVQTLATLRALDPPCPWSEAVTGHVWQMIETVTGMRDFLRAAQHPESGPIDCGVAGAWKTLVWLRENGCPCAAHVAAAAVPEHVARGRAQAR